VNWMHEMDARERDVATHGDFDQRFVAYQIESVRSFDWNDTNNITSYVGRGYVFDMSFRPPGVRRCGARVLAQCGIPRAQ